MYFTDDLQEAMEIANSKNSKLIFISVQDEKLLGLSSTIENVCFNHLLSEQLILVSRKNRARKALELASRAINSIPGSILLIKSIEILFDRTLAIDPVRLMVECSKNKTLIVCWPGDKSQSTLSFSIPSHQEYRSYKISDLQDVVFLEINGQRS